MNAGPIGTQRLSTWQIVAFGQLVMPMAVIGLPIAVYIPAFYSGTLGLDLAMVGFILTIARISDVFTDPIVGKLSDRTHTRWGRRRPWIIVGVMVMMVSGIMLFLPPENVSNSYLLLWIAAIYLGYTLIEIPYGAWGAELSQDYDERNRVTGSRNIFALIGLLIAISVPIFVGAMATGDAEEGAATREAMSSLGWLTVGLLPICLFIILRSVREPEVASSTKVDFFKGMRIVMRNGPLRIVLIATMLGALAGSINVGVAIFFFEHVAQLGKSSSILIFALFLAGVFGSPFWVRIGSAIGKHRGIGVAGFSSLAAFAFVPLIIYVLKPAHPELVFPALMLITVIQGFTMGASPILGQSILADVCDLDMIKSGEQRTAFLFSFLAMVKKMFEAIGIGIALPLLAWSGFDPKVMTNSDSSLFMLTAMYCLVPLTLWLISTTVIWQYPITHARQARLRAALDRRIARKAAANAETIIRM